MYHTLIWAIIVAIQYTKIMYRPDICTVRAYVPSGRMYHPDVCRLFATALPRFPELTVETVIRTEVINAARLLCNISIESSYLIRSSRVLILVSPLWWFIIYFVEGRKADSQNSKEQKRVEKERGSLQLLTHKAYCVGGCGKQYKGETLQGNYVAETPEPSNT